MANYNQVSYGSQGSDVKKLQEMLNSNGNYNLATDGIFGSKTQNAVKDFQKNNNLTVDGIAGTNTWGALTNQIAGTPKTADTATTTGDTQTKQHYAATDQPKTDVRSQGSGNSVGSVSTPGSGTSSGGWNSEFTVSDSTAAADQRRKEIENQKPGDFTYNAYEKSDAVLQAEAMLQQHNNNKPGEYQSQWQSQIDDTIKKILNREKFTYDLNGDALYQQYKDQYTLQGQQAMMDTMGQAQAMTGGYGNTYAQTVGQQTYQGYLQQLNDKVPELYQLALDQYNQEGQDLYNQYGLFMDQENQGYSRHRDTESDWRADRDYYTNDARYHSEQDYSRWADDRNFNYGQHRDEVSDWNNDMNRADADYWNQWNRDYTQYSDDRNLAYDNYWNQQNFNYQRERDQTSDQQWQATFNEGVRQFNEQMAQANGSGSGSSGSSGNSSGGGYTANPGWDEATVRAFQQAHGLTVDGIWGPNTAAAYDNDPNWTGSNSGSANALLNGMIRTGTTSSGYQVNNGTADGQRNLKSSISNEINAALAAGVIDEDEARRLREQYAPRGYTY